MNYFYFPRKDYGMLQPRLFFLRKIRVPSSLTDTKTEIENLSTKIKDRSFIYVSNYKPQFLIE